MTKRVAIYARVSTDDQRDNYSIPTQISESLEFVEKQGYAVVGDQFVDPITGTDRINGNGSIRAFVDDFSSRELSRPSLDAAIAYLEKDGFDALVVHSLDRLARDPYIRQTLEIEFNSRGATVEYVLGNYEDSPEGEVRKDLDATFAKWENLKRVERSKRGKRGKAERGRYPSGKPPYGYRLDATSLGGLAIDDYQANVVREIFNLYVNQGQSMHKIAERLTLEETETYRGNTSWAKSTVGAILRNSTYVGRSYYNRTQRNGNGRERRDRGDWIEIPVPPIINEAQFDEAQSLLNFNVARSKRYPKRFYLLSGKVICSDCGMVYGTQTQKAGTNRLKNDAPSYRHRRKQGHCRNHQISARKLEPMVWDQVKEILLDPESLRRGYETSLEQHKATYERQRRRLRILSRGREKLTRRQENLMTAYLDPDIALSKMEFLKQRERISGELVDLVARIEAIEEDLAKVAPPPELETIEAFASEISAELSDDFTKEEKRRILELLHIRVLMGEEMWIEGWIEPPRYRLSSTPR